MQTKLSSLPIPTNISRWAAIVVLAVASFVMVTSEFAPIGLLSGMATDLAREPSTIGLCVTLYAWVGAACGLLAGVVSQRLSRRLLLVVLMLVLACSNGLAAASGSFAALLGARGLGAVAHGLFWATVAATAANIAPPARRGMATAMVFAGITVATVAGVPLINLIGEHASWRSAFAWLAGSCALSAGLIAASLPALEGEPDGAYRGLGAVLRRRDLLFTYVITALVAAAHFGAFTFIEPFIRHVPGVSIYQVAGLLFAFGAAGFVGNLLSAVFAERYARGFILFMLSAMAVALLTLGSQSQHLGLLPALALLVIWGVAISALFTALHTVVLNGAIGVGVVLGGRGLQALGFGGAMLAAGALAIPAVMLLAGAWFRSRQSLANG